MINSLVFIIAIFVLTGVLVCHREGFSIRFWSICFPSLNPEAEVMNITLTKCLFECSIRKSCVAVQYQRVWRTCGILTSGEYQRYHFTRCQSYVIMHRDEIREVPSSCDPYQKSNLTGDCITECSIPENPALYSMMKGAPFVGMDVNIICDANFIQNGSTKSTCNRNGNFDKLPRCEIENNMNLAFGRTTQQSSVEMSEGIYFISKYAVDGIKSGNMYQDPCSHTLLEQHRPWLIVDLDHIYQITRIDIYFRLECCTNRFANIYIFTSSNKTELIMNNPWDAGTFCDMYEGPASAFERFIAFHCQKDVRGRYVKIVRNQNNATLELCEVEIYGDVL